MRESYRRAWAFDAALQERSAARVQRFDRGAALFTESVPRVYDANFVRLDDVAGLSATAATMLGTLAAIALVRIGRFRGRLLFSGMDWTQISTNT